MLEAAFPGGLAPIVTQSHEEQAAHTELLIEMFEGPLLADMAALGAADLVARLEADVRALREVLLAERTQGTRWSTVVDANQAGQTLLLETVALCIAAFPRASGESLAQRARVLAPVLAQNADIAAWRRRRPNAVDVDPDSGEVRVDADADTDAEAPADEPVDA